MAFWSDKKILITGGAGFFGSQVVHQLLEKGAARENILVPRSKEIDLRRWENCVRVVKNQDIVIHLAARVGGIGYNQAYPAQLFYDNAIMGIQMIEAARQENVEKCVIVGTICAYPKFTPVPFREDESLERVSGRDQCSLWSCKEDAAGPVPGIPAGIRL